MEERYGNSFFSSRAYCALEIGCCCPHDGALDLLLLPEVVML